MQHTFLSLLCLLLIGSINPTFAASDSEPCGDLELTVQVYDNSTMYCYFSVLHGTMAFSGDSVWITDENDALVMTGRTSLGKIDISSFEDGEYIVHAQRGNCIMEKSIYLTCAAYRHINMSVEVLGDSIVHYDMSNSGTITPPHIDSVWITNTKDSVVLTNHTQSGEPINISNLKDNVYFLSVRIGDCVLSRRFQIDHIVSDVCQDYRNINISITVSDDRSTMYYDMSNSGTITPPFVDSVWITINGYTNVVLTGHVQSGEPIDISGWKQSFYVFWVQIGDCVMSKRFVIRPPVTPDPCEEYQDIAIAVAVDKDNAAISYTLSDNGTTTPLHVDSIWLTNNAIHPVVLTGNAQPGESIDVSFLRKDMYVLWVKIGDCIIDSNTFRLGDTAMDIEAPADSETAVKIFRNGQLLIRRNSKTYTLQGVEITQ